MFAFPCFGKCGDQQSRVNPTLAKKGRIMPKLQKRIPKLCKHHKGHAFVKIDGRQIWLGRYGDPITVEAYNRVMAEWLINDRQLPAPLTSPRQPLFPA